MYRTNRGDAALFGLLPWGKAWSQIIEHDILAASAGSSIAEESAASVNGVPTPGGVWPVGSSSISRIRCHRRASRAPLGTRRPYT